MGKFEKGVQNLEASMSDAEVVESVIKPSKPTTAKKKKADLKECRINLALTNKVGEKVKHEAWKQHKSVNAYIEDVLIKELNI